MIDRVALDADVVILGAGPAGSVAALNLAPFLRVLVIDKALHPVSRIGESLPAAAAVLLSDMGLLESFQAQGHLPCRFIRSTWGDNYAIEQDEIRNLDGNGWYLERQRFDDWLQSEAERRGAHLLRGARLRTVSRNDKQNWLLQIEYASKQYHLHSKFLIDASGRQAILTKMLGVQRTIQDKLVCGWVSGTQHNSNLATAASGEIHAEVSGWWYSSPLPYNRRILAFFTDSDLDAAQDAQDLNRLMARLKNIAPLKQTLKEQGFNPDNYSFCTAHSATSNRVTGEHWLAVGDAALTFDPLSSQGIFNALYTGLAGATSLYTCLCEGDKQALPEYQKAINRIQSAYQIHKQAWYSEEKRWPESKFWQRRGCNVKPIS